MYSPGIYFSREPKIRFNKVFQGCVQKYKVIANVWPRIPVPNEERQLEHGSRTKHSWVTCTSERSPGDKRIKSAEWLAQCVCHFLALFFFWTLGQTFWRRWHARLKNSDISLTVYLDITTIRDRDYHVKQSTVLVYVIMNINTWCM